MPKCPCSSGPVRNELSFCCTLMRTLSHVPGAPAIPLGPLAWLGLAWFGLASSAAAAARLLLDGTRRGSFEPLRSLPCGAHEGADFLGVLPPGRALDTRGNVDLGSARDPQGLRHIICIKAPREHEGNAEIEILQQMPVEWLAEATRPRRLARRTCVEQHAIGEIGVKPDGR